MFGVELLQKGHRWIESNPWIIPEPNRHYSLSTHLPTLKKFQNIPLIGIFGDLFLLEKSKIAQPWSLGYQGMVTSLK